MPQPGGEEAVVAVFGDKTFDGGLVGFRGCGAERQRHLAKAELEQPVAAPRLAVVVALRHGARQNLDLPVVKPEAPVDRGDLRLDGAFVRKKHPRWAALDDRRRDGRIVDVGKTLSCEDDGSVFLSQRFQPFAKLAGEAFIVERQPALVDDEQRRTSVEPVSNTVKEIGEHGGRGAGADEALGLEGLNTCLP